MEPEWRHKKTLPGEPARDHAEKMTSGKRASAWWPAKGPRDKRQFSVQTLMLFIPVSASVRVLKVPLSTTVVVVVVGLLSTMVHFFVVASLTT
jgi:hypothetical protein